MVIDGVRIRKGTKKSWGLVAAETSASKVEVPITVINGLEEGPVLGVLAGCHPGEVVGVAGSIRLAKEIDPTKLAGVLLIVHLQNVVGFQFKTAYVSPIDGVNMGRAYPIRTEKGEDQGREALHQGRSVSYQIAHRIFVEVVSRVNYLVDLHGGELHESLASNIEIMPIGEEKVDQKMRKFAQWFGFDWVWEVPKGSIPEMPNYPGRGSAILEAACLGIPGVLCEVGGEGKIQESQVKEVVQGLRNVMVHLGMWKGEKTPLRSRLLRGGHVLFARRGGIFISRAEVGERVDKDQILGQVMDLSGRIVETFRSPSNGILLNKITLGIANPGDMLYVIGNLSGEADELPHSKRRRASKD